MAELVNVQLGDPRSELTLQGKSLRGEGIYTLEKDEEVTTLLRGGLLRKVPGQETLEDTTAGAARGVAPPGSESRAEASEEGSREDLGGSPPGKRPRIKGKKA